ncbi:MAG: hypothetical protein JWQ97_2093 [Phenylobacterium sp.]|nr:hypothetical protein [Phenylobacterium sp.]
MNRPTSWSRRRTLAALAAACSLGKASALAQAPTQVPAEPALPPGDAGARLESAFDQATRVSVPVLIDGRGPFPFVVDTGANSSVIGEQTARACALPVVAEAPVHGILSAQPAPIVQVKALQVGDVRSNHLRLPVLPESALGAAGLLGVDMLRNRRMVLDFAGKSFEIASSRSSAAFAPGRDSHISAPGEPVVVAARFRSGQLIIIDASAADRPLTAFLDSGSQVTVANNALRDLVLTAQPRLGAALINSSLVSATGQRASANFGPLPGLRIGRLLIDAPLVAFADLHIFELWKLQQTPSLLIGVDVLRRFQKIAFDYGRKELTLWPKRRGLP